jgi:hypothetical protein
VSKGLPADRVPLFALLEANAISQVGNMMTAVAVKREGHKSVIDSFTRTLH